MLIKENYSLQKESIIDLLTGLYNRRILDSLVKLPTIAIMCDIDNFKMINDTFGHDMGDFVINSIGSIPYKRVIFTQLCLFALLSPFLFVLLFRS